MIRKTIIVFILLFIVGISGCTINQNANQTFGEKGISLNALFVNNTTSDHYEYEETNYYYVDGDIINNNQNEVFHVKLNVSVFDEKGNLIGYNDTAYFERNSIPPNDKSYFYVDFGDNDNKISRYEIKIIDAKAYP